MLTNLHVLDLPESEKHNFGIVSVCEHDNSKTIRDTGVKFALMDLKTNYFVNGNWRVQSPGRVLVHGAEFMYNRTWDGHERLSSEGPTRLPLRVLVSFSISPQKKMYN
ncbi:hypothetical protein AVEN_101840-1 [Araneus ventricosus]|uniref:ADAMTS/ADAMTS-like Spacer 1 domain-containing protein n=1 Tax=Araneus ventricosus TaxID=182803 RepID=A0A4Y2RJB5_ARAVE|nr:hypothetical protein AVEN_2054-1 [Araneus ventricosus]GBN75897.1 hypothetical protein AVEN_101840-1 [Araneus ventricosus]